MSKRAVTISSIFALGVVLTVALHGRGAATTVPKVETPQKISEDADLSLFVLPTNPESRVKLPPGSKIIADSDVPRHHHHSKRKHRAPAGR